MHQTKAFGFGIVPAECFIQASLTGVSNNDAGLFGGGEDCMSFNYGPNGCWNDCDCNNYYAGAICQALP
jgi:hypothetical protein